MNMKRLCAGMLAIMLSLSLVGCQSKDEEEQLQKQVDQTQEQVDQTQEQLDQKTKELEAAQKKLSDYKAVYGDVIRTTESATENTTKSVLVVSSKNLQPILYSTGEEIGVRMGDCEYIAGGDLYITLDVQNMSSDTIYAGFDDLYIGDTSLSMEFENIRTYKPGDDVMAGYLISSEQLSQANITDFDKLNCQFVVRKGAGKETLLAQDVVVMRDAFHADTTDNW